MRFLVLTDRDAMKVRGPSLQPRLVEENVYILPLSVLNDPVHAEHHEFLASLPQEERELPEEEDGEV